MGRDLFLDKRVVEVYNKYSKDYHQYFLALDAILKFISKKSKIFEIGVGNGFFTSLLIENGYVVRGIDRSKEMLKLIPNFLKERVFLADLINYTGDGEKFDVVISHSGGFTFKEGNLETYYLEEEDLRMAFKRVRDLLKPNGIFCINKGKRPKMIDLGEGYSLFISSKIEGSFKDYTYSFLDLKKQVSFKKNQRRFVVEYEKLKTFGFFDWNYENDFWVIGIKQ